jgi:hypothetical protein
MRGAIVKSIWRQKCLPERAASFVERRCTASYAQSTSKHRISFAFATERNLRATKQNAMRTFQSKEEQRVSNLPIPKTRSLHPTVFAVAHRHEFSVGRHAVGCGFLHSFRLGNSGRLRERCMWDGGKGWCGCGCALLRRREGHGGSTGGSSRIIVPNIGRGGDGGAAAGG